VESIFLFILENIIKAVSEETTKSIYDYIKKKISQEGEKEENTQEYIIGDVYNTLKKYILDSLGGYENIVLAGNYGDGYKFIFNDLSKVKYGHMKNFDFRVFISNKCDSMILFPKVSNLG